MTTTEWEGTPEWILNNGSLVEFTGMATEDVGPNPERVAFRPRHNDGTTRLIVRDGGERETWVLCWVREPEVSPTHDQ